MGGDFSVKYRCIFFDLDGTLLDTLDDLRDSVNTILERYALDPISHREAAHFLGNGAAHLVSCAVRGRVPEEQEKEILEEYKIWYQAHCRIKTAPYPGIREMLIRLKNAGCRMAVVSNKPDPAVRELNAHFFNGLLETAVGEKPGIRRKPAPDMLLEAMRLFETDARECVYVGDTEVDLQTAANAGMKCISVSWGFRDEDELVRSGAEIIVRSAEELERTIL